MDRARDARADGEGREGRCEDHDVERDDDESRRASRRRGGDGRDDGEDDGGCVVVVVVVVVRRVRAGEELDGEELELELELGAALWTLEDVVERPDPLATHDPERDWLGAGPRWDVKWGGVRFVLTMLAVDASFYLAGFFAPVYTYVGTRAEEMIPSDPVLLQADLQRAYDDPVIFSHIFLNAEVTQIVLGLLILGLSVGPFAPLPAGWFNDIFSSDDPKRNATGRESQQWKRDAVKRAQAERSAASGREASRAIAGTFLGVALVTWALYVAGVRGGKTAGLRPWRSSIRRSRPVRRES